VRWNVALEPALKAEEIPMPATNSRRKSNANGAKHAPVPRQDRFSAFAQTAARWAGKPHTFIGAVLVVAVWALLGPLFGFSESWQLFINTTTTIVTFLMVFLIQSSQNRDTAAVQVKLAELILQMPGAPNQLADAEDMSEKQLDHLHEQYKHGARKRMRKAKREKSESKDA
jgi:low affinity Fe/Cu permease